MKKLEIIIRPSALDNVKDKLASLDIHGMTCTEVRGFGRQRGHTEVYRAAVYQVDFVAKIRLEIVVHDSMTESVVQAVMEAARKMCIRDRYYFAFVLLALSMLCALAGAAWAVKSLWPRRCV